MHSASRHRAIFLEEHTMKNLLRVLFILALVCGFTSHARANGVDFHAQVLDPLCDPDNTACAVGPTDIGVPFSISLDQALCTTHIPPVTGLPANTPYGCFFGTNLTGGPIDSFTLKFNNPNLNTDTCDTNLPGQISPSPAFSITGCDVDPSGGFDLTFSGGSIANTNGFVILEVGEDPAFFAGGSATIGAATPTPEPDSLLLLSTGVMMMATGLFMKQRGFALGKK
jgi:hypothetical protein